MKIDLKENYKPFKVPKNGIFNIDAEFYDIKEFKWTQKQETRTIIGETNDSFICKLLPSGHGEFINGKHVFFEYLLPLGVHKSRFIKWII